MTTHNTARRLGLASGTLVMAASLLSACASHSSPANIALNENGGPLSRDQYIVLTPAGRVPLRANSPVTVGGDLDASVSIVPLDGRWSRMAEVQLTQPANGNTPLDGATVLATASMPAMPQMICTGRAVPQGDGRYDIPMAFGMPGAWQMSVQVASGEAAGQITLEVDLPQAG